MDNDSNVRQSEKGCWHMDSLLFARRRTVLSVVLTAVHAGELPAEGFDQLPPRQLD
jgi:hypothetical protein